MNHQFNDVGRCEHCGAYESRAAMLCVDTSPPAPPLLASLGENYVKRAREYADSCPLGIVLSQNEYDCTYHAALWGLCTSRAELLAEVERVRAALLIAKEWDETGCCELPPEGKPRLSEICDEALGAEHREGEEK